MAASTVWGIDIGNSAIKAVKMVKSGANECKIVAFDVIDLRGDDNKDRTARLASALKTLLTNQRIGSDPVFVSVPGDICMPKEFSLPPGSESKFHELVSYEARQQIPLPLEQVEWGYERCGEMPDGSIGVALIAVRKSDIQDLMGMMDANKINLRGIAAAPLALSNYITYEFNPQDTTLVLDAGSKGTDFVVTNKRQIYFRTIQIAGRDITKDLENKFKVPFEKAEDLKKNLSQSPQMDKLLAVIEPTLRRLGAEVQRTIGFYKQKARGQKISRAYLLGHTFRLPKMAEFLQGQVREAPFAIVEGLQRVKIDPMANPQVWQNEYPTMAVAIGLGLQGLGLSDLKMNLIPKARVSEDTQRAWKPWVAASAAVILATLAINHFQSASFAERMKKISEDADAAKTAAETVAKDFKKQADQVPERRIAVERLARPGRDEGKILDTFMKLTSLDIGGKRAFGADSRMYLTRFYASRIPVVQKSVFPDDPDKEGRSIRDALKNNIPIDALPFMKGAKSIYAGLAKVGDLSQTAPELRPDLPMVVVLTGEIEGDGALQKLAQLEGRIKELDLVHEDRDEGKRIKTEQWEEEVPVEWVPTFDHKLELNKDKTAEEKTAKVTKFHMMFRLKDAGEIQPVEAPPEKERKGR